jgi:hypothetical protein
MPVTMHDILEAISESEGARWRTEEKIAEYLECDPDDPAFKGLISSMLVSGFIHRRGRALEKGPNVLRAAPLPSRFAGPPRRPDTGATAIAEDKLRVAPRIPLAEDEKPVGSASLADKEGSPACVAGVMTASGPTVRIAAPITQESKRDWSGADDDATIVLDDAGVDELARSVEDVIAAAEAQKDRYRELERETDRTRDERIAAEALRYDPAAPAREAMEWAERLMSEQWRVTSERKYQKRRQRWLDPFVEALDPESREAYDALEAEFQKNCNTPGDIGIDALVRAEQARRDIRAQQAEIVCADITAADVHRLFQVGDRMRKSSTHYKESQELRQIEKEILARAEPPGEIVRGRHNWLEGMLTHLSGEKSVDEYLYEAAAIERSARPVDDETMAKVLAARAANDAADEAYTQVAGMPIAEAEVSGQWGSIVVRATQGEEGNAHSFVVDMKPADADDSWTPGMNDGWRPTTGGLRRLVGMVTEMRDAAAPPGYRRKPAGVPPGVVVP